MRKKKTKIIIIAGIILVLAGSGYLVFGRKSKTEYDIYKVGRTTVTQIVSATGQVKPVESVDLGFEKSGRIVLMSAKVGDEVMAGQMIIALDDRDLRAQLLQAQANLSVEQANLEELQKGAMPEEISISEAHVKSAEQTVADAQGNLDVVTQKADADLQSVYSAGVSAGVKSANLAKSALMILSDLQYSHFSPFETEGIKIGNQKGIAVKNLLGIDNGGWWTSASLSTAQSGVFGEVKNLPQIGLYGSEVSQLLQRILASLQDTLNALNSIEVSSFTSTEKTSLSAEKSNIQAEIISIQAKIESIKTQIAANQSSISTAKNSLNSAQAALETAKRELELKKAGSSDEQIASQKARVDSSSANVESIRAQLSKNYLISPIAGVVTKQDAKLGEISTAGKIMVSIISKNQYQIEAKIPEADIAKVKTGMIAKTTLDAFGSGKVFEVVVALVEPAETAVEGVSTYKTVLVFKGEEVDSLVKSGMTANLDIMSERKENVLAIPQRFLLAKNGSRTTLIYESASQVFEKEVKAGLKGSDGMVEIPEGLEEGQMVAVKKAK